MTQPAPDAPLSPENIMLRVAEDAGLELKEIQELRLTTRITVAMGNDRLECEVGQPMPHRPEFVIFALFVGAQGERSTEGAFVAGEIRMYCVPQVRVYPKAPTDHGPPDVVPYVCFTMLGSQFRTDTMSSVDTFVAEVANEFKQMAILVDMIDEDELEECEKCGVTYDPDDEENAFCRGCGIPLPAIPTEEEEEPEIPDAAPTHPAAPERPS